MTHQIIIPTRPTCQEYQRIIESMLNYIEDQFTDATKQYELNDGLPWHAGRYSAVNDIREKLYEIAESSNYCHNDDYQDHDGIIDLTDAIEPADGVLTRIMVKADRITESLISTQRIVTMMAA